MYEKIVNEIKSNLGENKDLNRQYLSSQIEVYKDQMMKSRSSLKCPKRKIRYLTF